MNRTLVKILNRLGLLKFLNLNTHVEINNKTVQLPIKSSFVFQLMYDHETWMRILLERLKPIFPGSFVDIGVNLGQTLIKAQTIFENPNYLGFEPNPFCVAYVDEMIKLNKWQNCTIIPTGVSDNTGVLKLSFYDGTKADASASIVDNFRPDEKVFKSIYIPVVKENSIQNLLPRVRNSLLKIDVEGAELEVMTGLQNWIKEYRPVTIAEILPVYSKDNSARIERQKRLESLINSLDYSISRIDKEKMRLIELNEIGIHGDIEKSDYLIYPSELRERIGQLLNYN